MVRFEFIAFTSWYLIVCAWFLFFFFHFFIWYMVPNASSSVHSSLIDSFRFYCRSACVWEWSVCVCLYLRAVPLRLQNRKLQILFDRENVCVIHRRDTYVIKTDSISCNLMRNGLSESTEYIRKIRRKRNHEIHFSFFSSFVYFVNIIWM